ncbi:MAG: peptide deformylase [Pseudomonadota bacterium]
MAIRDIIRMGHPTLRQPAEPVPAELFGSRVLADLLTDLRDTLESSGGIGLAAPQINVPLQVALIDLPGGPSRYGELPSLPATYFVNPEVEILDPATAGYWEGCLSVPGLRGFVERPQQLRVRASTPEGEPFERVFEGFPATVIQHEFDHLNGHLYIDHIRDPRLLMFEAEYEQFVLGPEVQSSG